MISRLLITFFFIACFHLETLCHFLFGLNVILKQTRINVFLTLVRFNSYTEIQINIPTFSNCLAK